jgi:DNA-directed RNA polymerase specialized sigma24 family protein
MTAPRPAGSDARGQEAQRPERARPEASAPEAHPAARRGAQRGAPEKLPRKAKKNRKNLKNRTKGARENRVESLPVPPDSTDRVKITEPVAPVLRSTAAEDPMGGETVSAAGRVGTAIRPDPGGEPAEWDDAAGAVEDAEQQGPPDPDDPDAPVSPAEHSAMHAFDLLYVRHAGPIGQQCYLLCGDRDIAARAVADGFRLAWERWPEVAVDRDPAGWVRAAAYEYALSPWHRLRPARRRPRVRGGTPQDQQLLDALLGLPASYRRSLVLHDALGLGLPDTAAEVEATTAAAAARIARAHEVLADRIPRLGEVPPDKRGALLGDMLEQLTGTQPIRPLPASRARLHSERITRRRLAAALALVGLLLAAILVSVFG